MAPVQMQTGAQQIPTTSNLMPGIAGSNQRQGTSELTKLLNQVPIIRSNAPNTVSAISGGPKMTTLQQQLTTRPMIPNMNNPRVITPQGPGGQTIMMTRPPINVNHQNQTGTLNPSQPSSMDQTQNQGIESRKVIWTGELQWKENSKLEPNTNKKMEHTVVCSVTSKKDDNGLPEVKPDNWPPKLIMQLIPKTLVQKLGGHFFNHSRSVLFHPQKSDSLDILTRVLGTGYAGCVVSIYGSFLV